MSIKLMSAIWDDERVGANDLLLLLALADAANDDGFCWPSIATLARRIRMNERNTYKHLRDLEASGALKRSSRRGRSTVYQVIVSKETPLSQETPLSLETGTPVAGDRYNHNGTIIDPCSIKSSSELRSSEIFIEREGRAREAKKTSRKVDPLWDAFSAVIPAPTTESGRGSWNRALKDLRAAAATPEQVAMACGNYRRRWPNALLTPSAITKHWSAMTKEDNYAHQGSPQPYAGGTRGKPAGTGEIPGHTDWTGWMERKQRAQAERSEHYRESQQ